MAFGDWVQGTSKDAGSVTSTTLAYTSNVTAGNSLICHVRHGGATDDTTVSDNLNGTWTKDKTLAVTSAGVHQVWRFSNTAGGACTVTVAFTTAATMRFIIEEYAGNFSLDTASTIAQGASTAPSSGAVTTTHTCAIIGSLTVGVNVGNNNNIAVAGTNYTKKVDLTTTGDAGTHNRTAVASEIFTTGAQAAGSYTADWSLPLSDNWGAAIVAYFDAGGGGPTPVAHNLVFPNLDTAYNW